ncbi:MAG: TVP38/TMEM64 family protein [Legionella sp.]|uniref:TVP38/TMEM64 family protein n=1 Tax=Legionella sp. TaxID=459 RepID=UPI0039E71A93
MRFSFPPLKIFFIILVLITLITTAFLFQKYSSEIILWVNQLGWLAPVLFLSLYCLATVLFLPTMMITFAGGVIFGPLAGTVLNLLGATWGATCSFLITRHLISDWVLQNKGTRINKLIYEVEQKGWMSVAILRLFPIIPFNIVNYGLGMTQIKFRTYLITTFIFLIPPEIIYTYFGYAGMDIFLTQGTFYRNSGIIISGSAILILFLIKLRMLNPFKRAKKPLNPL